MRGERLSQSCLLEEFFLGQPGAVRRLDPGHAEFALRQRSRLVEDDRSHLRDRLKIVAALHEDADLRRRADSAKEAERHGDHECAGARHDQENAGAVDPVREASAQDERRDQREERGADRDNGRVPARKPRDKVLEPRLLIARVLDQFKDSRNRGVLIPLLRPDPQHAFAVHAAADHGVADGSPPRDRFAGQSSSIEERIPLDHDAVQRDPTATLWNSSPIW